MTQFVYGDQLTRFDRLTSKLETWKYRPKSAATQIL